MKLRKPTVTPEADDPDADAGQPSPRRGDLPPTPWIKRARRPLQLKFSTARVVVWSVGLAVILSLSMERAPWWVSALIGVVWTALVFVARRDRALWEYLWDCNIVRRRRLADRDNEPLPPGGTTEVDGVGIRRDGLGLVSIIELAPDPAATRLAGGRAITESTVPLDLLASMMTQYGLDVSIDVVSTGRRVPPGPLRSSYAQRVGFHPGAVAERLTWLVLRVDMMDNISGIAARGPSQEAGPRSLGYATRRLEQRLGERRIRARVVPQGDLNSVRDALLAAGGEVRRENWGDVTLGDVHSTSYVLDPRRLTTAAIDRIWAVESLNTTVVLQLRAHDTHSNSPRIGGLVRYETDIAAVYDDEATWRHTGEQLPLLKASLPGGDSSTIGLPDVELDLLDSVEVPIGPAGPLLGIAPGGEAVALPLYDGSGAPVSWQVEVCADLAVAQVMLLRSIGAGASVEVRTARPEQWRQIVRSVADQRMSIADPQSAPHGDITVYDGVPVDVLPPKTLLTLQPRGAAPAVTTADVTIIETAPAIVEVKINRRAPLGGVNLELTQEELRYAVTPVATEAQQQTRTGRAPVRPTAPRRRQPQRQEPSAAPDRTRPPGLPSVAARLAAPTEAEVEATQRRAATEQAPPRRAAPQPAPGVTPAPAAATPPPAAPATAGSPETAGDPRRSRRRPAMETPSGPAALEAGGRHRPGSPAAPGDAARPPRRRIEDPLAARRARIRGTSESEGSPDEARAPRRRAPLEQGRTPHSGGDTNSGVE